MTDIDSFTNENEISNVDARGLKRPSSVARTDALKKPKVDDDDEIIVLEATSPSTSSGHVTPLPVTPTSAVNSLKKFTPKLSKEEREAERVRKAALKRLREEERERAKAEKEKIAEEKRLEKERKEKEREERRREEEKKKEEKRREEEERKERKQEERREAKRREEEERKEAKRREEELEDVERSLSDTRPSSSGWRCLIGQCPAVHSHNVFHIWVKWEPMCLSLHAFSSSRIVHPGVQLEKLRFIIERSWPFHCNGRFRMASGSDGYEERLTAIEEKKRRASARFIGFFSKVERKRPETTDRAEDELWYKPFEVKDGMRMAPIHRRPVLHLDDDILKQETDPSPSDYLPSLCTNPRKLVGVAVNPMRAKFYQFHDNCRPPYYGTWRTRSKFITGRRPFTTKDENIDYEVDSDGEWEDEPSDAEECKSDEEEDAGGDSDVDSDHEAFFVQPGYLSAGEGDEASDDDDDDADDRAASDVRDVAWPASAECALRESVWCGSVPAADRLSEWYCSLLSVSTASCLVATPSVVYLCVRGSGGMRQHSMSSVRKLNELVHECNLQLALFRNATQGIGTSHDGASLRREVETAGRACLKACEAAKKLCFYRNYDMKVLTLEKTFPAPTEPSITPQQIANMESMLVTLENLITVHFSTSESSPTDKVTPRRRRATSCRPQCVCSKLKTSYA
ncbi:hypothetical protein KIN20_005782 [Parelaphostrongylus tenuis]|uniref:Chromatin assembly factor 1 subunit A dimerization domain-containing protein n=1 Tax=Parelaphostrongylus tenuis TaxID=148309 RepID=A0AAD5M0N6_PARTN|nr:hypothetical protein KIN20_005782 [Parelaphostrongylus tenuis]